MPLHHGTKARTIKANIARNIRTEIHAGYKPKQAAAIAYSVARRDARRAHVRVRGIVKHRARHHWH